MTQIQLRRGTASEWTAANPVLAAGEVGIIGTTGDFKIGDGATTWNLLPAQSSRYAPVPTAWNTVGALNGTWVNFGSTYQVFQYRKVGDDVQVRGLIKSGTVPSSVFTFPAGHRPPGDLFIGSYSNGAFAYLTLAPSGLLSVAGGSPASVALNFQFSTIA